MKLPECIPADVLADGIEWYPGQPIRKRPKPSQRAGKLTDYKHDRNAVVRVSPLAGRAHARYQIHETDNRMSTCPKTGKRVFDSRDDALAAVEVELTADYLKTCTWNLKLHVYNCPSCKHWHLTKQRHGAQWQAKRDRTTAQMPQAQGAIGAAVIDGRVSPRIPLPDRSARQSG
jgi:hypothetical protein